MPTPTVRIISIGALARHPMWDEAGPVRTGHATCTLIRSGDACIIVDPGLPPEIIAARLNERSGLRASDITHVFLTSFQPDTTRGLLAFEKAPWLISNLEREAVGIPLVGKLKLAVEQKENAVRDELARQISLLQRCKPVDRAGDGDAARMAPENNEPDADEDDDDYDQDEDSRDGRGSEADDHDRIAEQSLAPGVDLFPLPGITPGLCGLIIDTGDLTTLICGDALATSEHYAQRKVLPLPYNLEQAKASFAEAMQIADILIPGRDNLLINELDLGPSDEEMRGQ
jgi:glyoxylase-like metal-dependent hydrolase (beta-lactamase superfamily II)